MQWPHQQLRMPFMNITVDRPDLVIGMDPYGVLQYPRRLQRNQSFVTRNDLC
jgi:hypothetical protein